MEEEKRDRFKHVILPIIIAVFSFFVLSRIMVSIPWTQRYVKAIEDSNLKTSGLMTGALGVSELIRTIPGDTGNSTADTLAQLSRMFMIVKGALYLEETILIVSAPVAFKVLVPVACVFHAIGYGLKSEGVKSISLRIIALAVALVLLVPVSLELSGLIEATCENAINETIESAEDIKSDSGQTSDEQESVVGKVLAGVKNIVGKVTGQFTQVLENAKNLINRMIESFIIMLITTCLIPVLVILLFIRILKRLFDVDVGTEKYKTGLGNFVKNGAKKGKDKKVETEQQAD